MKRVSKIVAAISVAIVAITALSGCESAADRASYNLHQSVENFEVNRRIVFLNGITDKYLLTIEGRCSVETSDSALGGSLEVVCKLGEDQYKKHFLGLSDNVSYFVEQLESVDVSLYHYRVIFRPETIIPDLEVSTGKQ